MATADESVHVVPTTTGLALEVRGCEDAPESSFNEVTIMNKMQSAWLGPCLVVLAAASCDFARLPELADDLEPLAGDIGGPGNVDGSGADAHFYHPGGVTVDSAGNVYVADLGNHTIRKVTAAGVVTTLAGTAGMSGSTDGTGAAARFNVPAGVAVDSAGNVYVADRDNGTIRKVTPTGITTTVAGTAGVLGIVLGATPRLGEPRGLAIVGDSIVLCDTHAILLLRHGAR